MTVWLPASWCGIKLLVVATPDCEVEIPSPPTVVGWFAVVWVLWAALAAAFLSPTVRLGVTVLLELAVGGCCCELTLNSPPRRLF